MTLLQRYCDQRYRTILVDPPWPYTQRLGRGKGGGDTTRGGLPYRSMLISEIEQVDVPGLAAANCMLWLWTTNAHLHSAFHLIEHWGFTYKTMVTWGKAGFGLGYWLRGATEHLLLAVKGNPRSGMTGPHGTTGKSWSTLVTAKREGHSHKPQVFIDMIEDISLPPRIELFARSKRLGWDVLGEEVGTCL